MKCEHHSMARNGKDCMAQGCLPAWVFASLLDVAHLLSLLFSKPPVEDAVGPRQSFPKRIEDKTIVETSRKSRVEAGAFILYFELYARWGVLHALAVTVVVNL